LHLQNFVRRHKMKERKNRSLKEIARIMLNEHSLPKYFWAKAVNTACYIINRVVIRSKLENTPYELWKGRTPNISYFKVFGYKYFILNDKDNLGKFDAKSDEGIFLGYSMNIKAYRVYNKRSLTIEESYMLYLMKLILSSLRTLMMMMMMMILML
jgi:hypothetical protein